MMTSHPTPRVLLVEDDEVDRMQMERAFSRAGLEVEMITATDGVEALAELRGDRERDPLAPPYIVVLDLNMPRMGGLDFLRTLREDSNLKRTVVFILTTSSHEEEIADCYELGAAGYTLKGQLMDRSVEFAELLSRYWSLVELPTA